MKHLSKKSVNERYVTFVKTEKGSNVTNFGFKYESNDVSIGVSAYAYCNPEDKFDIMEGVETAQRKIVKELKEIVKAFDEE